MKNKNQILGELGEMVAVKYLAKSKYKLISTNYKTKAGEIDIIAKDRSHLVFIEVKTRETGEFLTPSEAVNKEKQAKIKTSAELFLRKHVKKDISYRFDIIEVISNDNQNFHLNHIKSAFAYFFESCT